MIATKITVIIYTVICLSSNTAKYIKHTDENELTVSKGMKYILNWIPDNYLRFTAPGPNGVYKNYSAQTLFLIKKCPVNNCYLTEDKDYFLGDLRKFHAILFTLPQSHKLGRNSYLLRKYENQKYIYASTESAQNHPVCTTDFDHFFDWTFTYRLDSDIVYNHMTIRDIEGNVVGPKQNINWMKKMKKIHLTTQLKDKTKAAAWFPSKCVTKSKREYLVNELNEALKEYGYGVDVYGPCGNTSCLADHRPKCYAALSKEYYFYLAFEDSFSIDYVTDYAVNANYDNNLYIIPIVYGGANYSNFLPPGSYINARKLTPELLAFKMVKLMKNYLQYSRYFRWKSYYKMYTRESGLKDYDDGVCDLCKMLNDKEKVQERKNYGDFRKWWYPYYKDECKRIVGDQ